MSDTENATTEIVADVAEEVADQATHIAEVSRGLSGHDLGLVFGGLVVGAGLGAALGYIFAQRKLETKYSTIAAEEIAEMRQHYAAKTVALENSIDKPKLEELVREQGYSSESASPPMAVEPPTSVVERANEVSENDSEKDADKAPSEPEVRNVFQQDRDEDEWDWHKERTQRSPLRAYIIHRDERDEQETYDSVTFTYYEADDVLCNESDDVIDAPDRERIVGETNLDKFGHGSGDANIVYIRNPKEEMDIEVVRSANSYAEEVHGFEPDEPEIRHADRRRGRPPYDDE